MKLLCFQLFFCFGLFRKLLCFSWFRKFCAVKVTLGAVLFGMVFNVLEWCFLVGCIQTCKKQDCSSNWNKTWFSAMFNNKPVIAFNNIVQVLPRTSCNFIRNPSFGFVAQPHFERRDNFMNPLWILLILIPRWKFVDIFLFYRPNTGLSPFEESKADLLLKYQPIEPESAG